MAWSVAATYIGVNQQSPAAMAVVSRNCIQTRCRYSTYLVLPLRTWPSLSPLVLALGRGRGRCRDPAQMEREREQQGTGVLGAAVHSDAALHLGFALVNGKRPSNCASNKKERKKKPPSLSLPFSSPRFVTCIPSAIRNRLTPCALGRIRQEGRRQHGHLAATTSRAPQLTACRRASQGRTRAAHPAPPGRGEEPGDRLRSQIASTSARPNWASLR